MTRHNPFEPDLESKAADEVDEVDQILGEYLDRLNCGEEFDRQQILSEHPGLGQEVLRRLEVFIDLDSDADQESSLGTLGDYTLRRQIGRGGMGVVYEAWEGSMDRVVALKVLPPGVAADNKAFARFMREAKTAGQLHHPNVVGVYSTGVKEGTPWYSMEFVEGETLAQILGKIKAVEPEAKTVFGKKDRPAYFETLAETFADVADGLQHAHSKGVVHRDIKPSNLILDDGKHLRILDFGLAHLEGQESLTLSGDVVGTPLYMSPEQAKRRKIPIDHRTDIYSLGATLYEMLTSHPPFRGKDHQDTLSQIVERDPVEPRKLNPRVPSDLDTIVLKCLRKDAGDRYGTAEALGQDLRRFVRGDAIEASRQAPFERWVRAGRRHKRTLFVLGLCCVCLVTSAVFVRDRLRESSNRRQLQHDLMVRSGIVGLQLEMSSIQRGIFKYSALRANPRATTVGPLGRAREDFTRASSSRSPCASLIYSPVRA